MFKKNRGRNSICLENYLLISLSKTFRRCIKELARLENIFQF
jgi:hypothetical protein